MSWRIRTYLQNLLRELLCCTFFFMVSLSNEYIPNSKNDLLRRFHTCKNYGDDLNYCQYDKSLWWLSWQRYWYGHLFFFQLKNNSIRYRSLYCPLDLFSGWVCLGSTITALLLSGKCTQQGRARGLNYIITSVGIWLPHIVCPDCHEICNKSDDGNQMILNSLALELQMGLIHQSLMVMIDRSVEYVILVSVIVLAMLSPPSGSFVSLYASLFRV